MLADTPPVDRTPAFSRDERILAILAGGLGIGVSLESGKTDDVTLTGSVLMTFVVVDGTLSS